MNKRNIFIVGLRNKDRKFALFCESARSDLSIEPPWYYNKRVGDLIVCLSF